MTETLSKAKKETDERALNLFFSSTIGIKLNELIVCRNCDFYLSFEDVDNVGFVDLRCHGCNTRVAVKMPKTVRLAYEILHS